jgi:D-erythronate 2-dehydrogenase
VGPEVEHPILSPSRTIAGLIRCAEASDAEWGPLTGLNLPALRCTVAQMAAALERIAGPEATSLLDWQPDADILKLVNTWPGHVKSARASALGLAANPDFDDVIREYVREYPQAVKLKLR